ncbi:MAG: PH domain-containing protein [Methanomassiliicoccales archaeon]|nr:PH domain-containing protein [Methanomassiliicoccales archaeon]MDD1755271.1 PH domain-containing protein [Methanomassiliicoccales archaeon]
MDKASSGDVVTAQPSGVAKRYLVEGENLHWQGKPATIVIVGRGVLLTALALVFALCLWLGPKDLAAIAIALVACVLMMITDTRYGLIAGAVGIVIILIMWAMGTDGLWVWLILFPLIFSLIYLLANIIYLGRVLFIITDRRIITRYGIFSLRYAELDIERIQNITVLQPWYERLLGYGDVFFATAGEQGGIDYQKPGIKLMSGGAVTWEDVSKPFEVVHKVNDITHSGSRTQSEGRTASSGISDAEVRLRQLSDLSTKGLISQQEYQQKRDEILGKI